MNDIFNFDFYRNIVVSAITILLFNSIFQYIKHLLERSMGFHNSSMNKKYEVYPKIYSKFLIAWGAILSCRGAVEKPNFKNFSTTEINTYLKESLNLLDKDIEVILTLWEKENFKSQAIELVDDFWKKNQERIAEDKFIELNNYSNENDIYLSTDLSILVHEIKSNMSYLLLVYKYPDPRESTSLPENLRKTIKEELDDLKREIREELKINKTSIPKILWNKLSSLVLALLIKLKLKKNTK
ncbi:MULTISPECIES: hypothetical protein [Bacillus]|uniref:Uncharacterized protein n=1 Tax=Bacillus licheniformis TaxID=1402 RepID=A0AB37GLW6_BACLI|nr:MULTISPECIES: hypothetical protein [Bacillus]MCB6219078.1 hypothetical protein [Bacillus paralicheniformis]MCY7999365.1 hypothetical protein [Bacillus haynesii]MCY8539717.1 hypothetical protein [Bacillus haynesii]QPR74027.1 hypothetical protein I6G80_07105 [Bacillus licheniformis]